MLESVILYHRILVDDGLTKRVLVGDGLTREFINADPTRILVDISSIKGIGK